MKLVWSTKFTRIVRKVARRRPSLLDDLNTTLLRLEADPHHPALRTHKLGGELEGSWACSVGYDLRIVFEFVHNRRAKETEIHLLSLGTHDEVY